ncbi:cytochrome c3 family protein [Rhodopirellula halodulae]|uniref:cytochrome c3 family protein n=1 Tax=Rhodopirellula halodulae TaxID=2894198 RepID=UPI001E2A3830|nr:cytochrome c3 family protein [Rhodopirellula sp. JC737]MCC9655503.1 cytochrome c3 family protein [Rhodopirellula sp. JC737]
MSGVQKAWLALVGINLLIGGVIAYSAFASSASTKTMFLPGDTSHGHYQIELRCDVCHTEGSGLREDACLNCHADELKLAKDTHPASKFNDPSNAELLSVLDAQSCITCHREHLPEQTLEMGLTMPADYCYHCHQETLETRPSHANFAFDSCATAGCHNYHDNRALYENFLVKHAGEPDFLDQMIVLGLEVDSSDATSSPLTIDDADAPADWELNEELLADWSETAHAAAGVNCSGCHQTQPGESSDAVTAWSDMVSMQSCEVCHSKQVETFVQGHHGMRLAQDLSPMTPAMARLPMHVDAAHRELTCNACHPGHRFDTQTASVDACVGCHNDDHSRSYLGSGHHVAWQSEMRGEADAGSGVSCATCHMPRLEDSDGEVWVQHNQNDNLRPNEKMLRDVCMNCHGPGFSIDALADEQLIQKCFDAPPTIHIDSVDLAKARFDEQQRKREARRKKK